MKESRVKAFAILLTFLAIAAEIESCQASEKKPEKYLLSHQIKARY